MAARKAETETQGSSVSEVRAKSAVVGTESQPMVANSDPSYEVITQQFFLFNVCHYQPESEQKQ